MVEIEPFLSYDTHGLAFTSHGRVKERAQKINQIFIEGRTKVPMPNTVNKASTSAKVESKEFDAETFSVHSPFDSLKRRWMISTSNCDYNELVVLLKQEPSLANFKDFTSGYTALHWAAKFGQQEIIKLIAGTHGVNTNIKSHGGFTPLHLAAMYNQPHVINLLTKVFGADPGIRDHSGKLAEQYYKPDTIDMKSVDVDNQSNISGSLGSLNKLHLGAHFNQSKSQDKSRHESSAFTRIGSFNNKVRKTAAAITGIKGWASIQAVSDLNSLPPPKQSSSIKKKGKNLLSMLPLDKLSLDKVSKGHSIFIDKYISNRSSRTT